MRETDTAAWSDFASRRPEANLYHTLQWRDLVIEVFGHQPVYLLAELEGNVCGALPMFLVKARLLGSKLISMPYDIGSGGALADDAATERLLVENAMALARELGVDYLELRYGSDRPALHSLRLQRSEPVLISETELDSEASVRARVKDDSHRSVRKAERRGVTVREGSNLEDYRAFYDVYLQVFRDFGTPPYGGGYFPALWRRLGPSGAARLLLAEVNGRCVGGLLLFCWGKNLVSKFAACLPEAVPLRAYAALSWRAIQFGLEHGYRRLSWGTSGRDQTGLVEFKERWGAQTRPAVFYDLPVLGRAPMIERYWSCGGPYLWMRRAWRLAPLWATRIGGETLNRWFC
jgi:hypothetical protein